MIDPGARSARSGETHNESERMSENANAPHQYPIVVSPKSPALALIASFFFPGLGQLINGEVGKGIAMLALYFVSWMLAFVLIGFLFLPIVWIWSMIDAYSGAKNWNTAHGIIS